MVLKSWVRVRGLVGRVRVWSWLMHYVYRSHQKVCVVACEIPVTQ